MVKVVQIVIFILFLLLGRTDRKNQEIPAAGIWLFGIVSLLGGVYRFYIGELSVFEILFGGSTGLFVLLYSIFSKEQIGTGDGLLLLFLGIFCGRKVMFILWLASLSGCVKALYLLISKKGNRKTKFAFVPALGVSYAVSLFL